MCLSADQSRKQNNSLGEIFNLDSTDDVFFIVDKRGNVFDFIDNVLSTILILSLFGDVGS